MKKAISTFVCMSLVMGTMSGCLGTSAPKEDTKAPADTKIGETGSSGSEAAGDNAAADSAAIDYNASFELRMMTSLNGDARSKLIDEAITIFNEKWPNVTISNESTTDYAQKFQLSFSSGDGYDIVYVDDLNQQMLMEGNYLMDITEDVKERGWLDKTVPGAIEFNNLRTPGQYYSTAFLMAPIVVYYNKDIFKELGVEVPKTINELETVMAKAKEAGYIPTECAGDVYHQILWMVQAMVLNGAPKEEIDNWYYGKECSDNVKNAFIDAYAKVKEWYDNDYFREGFEGTKMADIPTLFSQGQTAFVVGGDWDIALYEATGLNVGAFVFPGFSEDEAPYIVNATDGAWALNANLDATQKEAALDFIDVFYQDDYVKRWYEEGFTLATTTDVSGVETSELRKEIAESTKNTQIGFYLDNTKAGYLDYLVKETQLFFQGAYTPEELWESLNKEWSNR